MIKDDDDKYSFDPLYCKQDALHLARNIRNAWRKYGIEVNCTVTAEKLGNTTFFIITSDLDKQVQFNPLKIIQRREADA